MVPSFSSENYVGSGWFFAKRKKKYQFITDIRIRVTTYQENIISNVFMTAANGHDKSTYRLLAASAVWSFEDSHVVVDQRRAQLLLLLCDAVSFAKHETR